MYANAVSGHDLAGTTQVSHADAVKPRDFQSSFAGLFVRPHHYGPFSGFATALLPQ